MSYRFAIGLASGIHDGGFKEYGRDKIQCPYYTAQERLKTVKLLSLITCI